MRQLKPRKRVACDVPPMPCPDRVWEEIVQQCFTYVPKLSSELVPSVDGS